MSTGMATRRMRVQRLDVGMPLPSYAHPGDAGLDLRAVADVRVPVHGRVIVGTGLAVEIPHGCAGLVLPRSGLAFEHGVTLANAPGLIDSGYRGEIRCCLLNNGSTPVDIQRHDRVAQLVVVTFTHVFMVDAHALSESARGTAGYGSTGRQ